MPPTRFPMLSSLALLLVFGTASVSAQGDPRPITVGVTRTMHSAVLGEDREVLIALPESYDETTVAYPLLVLLDGSPDNLIQASGIVQFLASARHRVPEMLVVAIPNTNRQRDLTPGLGAVAFERFLAEELLPWISKNYRAAPDRILVGHSLGGSLAVHILLHQPALFRSYVVVSPPVWRYEGLAEDIARGMESAGRAGATVTLVVGEGENANLRGGVERFAAELRSAESRGLRSTLIDLPGGDHSSTWFPAVAQALEARYAAWRFPFFEDSLGLAKAGGFEALQAMYARMSASFGYRIAPPVELLLRVARMEVEARRYALAWRIALDYRAAYPVDAERVINQIGLAQLRGGAVPEALATFRRNAALFPAALNVHRALAEALCRAGETAAARQSYAEAARLAEERADPRRVAYRAQAVKGCAG